MKRNEQQQNEPMTITLRFYKFIVWWFADVKGHTMAENRMVSGADTFLEKVSEGHKEIWLDISAEIVKPDYLYGFSLVSHDENGAEYQVIASADEELVPLGTRVWICDVTHDVFGEHTNRIYINSIEYERNDGAAGN